MSDADVPVTFAIRISERANRDIEATYLFLADQFSETMANKWRLGLVKAIM